MQICDGYFMNLCGRKLLIYLREILQIFVKKSQICVEEVAHFLREVFLDFCRESCRFVKGKVVDLIRRESCKFAR